VVSLISAQQQADQNERIALILTVPRLRAAMLDQISQAMQLLARAMAERAGRRPDDFTIRTVAGAVVGAATAASAAVNDDPDTDLPALIDRAIAHLEPGLTLQGSLCARPAARRLLPLRANRWSRMIAAQL
jgi:hypothetical protein